MAGEFYEGFDAYASGISNGLAAGRWSDLQGNWSIVTPGRQGIGSALRGTGGVGGSGGVITHDLPGVRDHIVLGWAFRANSGLPGFEILASFHNVANEELIQLRLNSAGELVFYRPTTATVILSSSDHITGSTYHHITLDITFDNSIGAAELWIDGVSVGSVSGIDTIDSAVVVSDDISLFKFHVPFAASWDFDDVYVADHTAGRITTGGIDGKVIILHPTADTVQKDFTPNSGTQNFAMVDDLGADEDATINVSSTPNDEDLFQHEPIPFPNATIFGVQMCVRAKKTDVATRLIEPRVESNGVDVPSIGQSLSTVYRTRQQVFEDNPDGVVQWINSSVDAALIGYLAGI